MESLEKLAENFALFDDWEGRYRYLIDLGRGLPAMDEALKTDETLVRGCTSRVWLVAQTKDGTFHFTADSDAHIVRGLIALLVAAYQDKPVSEVSKINIEETFRAIGLEEHLSPNRRSGFYAMVERIRQLAA
ncbi:MAG: SufE family protein [Alphaproteobacteria bacterium]|nr:SufE family protein [Alphaproteobacteria bacterium]